MNPGVGLKALSELSSARYPTCIYASAVIGLFLVGLFTGLSIGSKQDALGHAQVAPPPPRSTMLKQVSLPLGTLFMAVGPACVCHDSSSAVYKHGNSSTIYLQQFETTPFLTWGKPIWGADIRKDEELRKCKMRNRVERITGPHLVLPNGYLHKSDNLYEEISQTVYPTYLLHEHLKARGLPSTPRTIHLTAPRKRLPFMDLLAPFTSGYAGVLHTVTASRCVLFEDNLYFLKGAWVLDKFPADNSARMQASGDVQGAGNLQQFTAKLLQHYNIAFPKSIAPTKLVFAARSQALGTRSLINGQALAAAIRESTNPILAGLTVHYIHLHKKFPSIVDQMRFVANGTAVFVFMHGGAGPQVLWLPPYAAVVEVFPAAWTDPMYRNWATATGKSYRCIQPSNASAEDRITTNKHNWDTFVDLAEFLAVIEEAVCAVRSSFSNNFAPVRISGK